MRRWWLAAGAGVAAIAAWVVVAALPADVPHAEAQSATRGQATTPGIELRRLQEASFLPSIRSRDPVFVLAIGSDARPGVCMPVDRCLADSIHLLGVNTEQGRASIVGFPRDSYVEIPGHGEARMNEALREGGPELLVKTVEELTGVTIDYYLLTSFEGLTAMVDAIGGINVEIPYPMNDPLSGTNFEPGIEHLDGREALRFSRDRKSVPNGDFSRSENQGRLIVGALRALHRDVEEDPAELFRWIIAGIRNIDTDLSFTEIFDLTVTALSIREQRVTNVVVPGKFGFAGAASIVTLGEEADALFDDLRDDGLVEEPAA